MTDVALLAQAQTQFEAVLAAVEPEQWPLMTPCEGWDVAELAWHLVRGEEMAVKLLDGLTADEALAMVHDQPPADVNLLDAFLAAASASRGAFADPGALERTVHHPVGDVPGAMLLSFRIGDLTLHSWDLARTIGAEEGLPSPLVESVWDNLEPLKDVIGSIGLFGDGPSGTVGEDAELQLRLLDLTGRRP
jgi:uncharacterized protein (TIGR03086 family)